MNPDLFLAIYKPKMVKGYTSHKSFKLEFSLRRKLFVQNKLEYLMILMNFHIVKFIFAEVVLNNLA